jgi:hypothetical protein
MSRNNNIVQVNINNVEMKVISIPSIFNTKEIQTWIISQIKPITMKYTKIQSSNFKKWMVFNALFYLESKSTDVSYVSFKEFKNIMKEHFMNEFSNSDILYLWLLNKTQIINSQILKMIVASDDDFEKNILLDLDDTIRKVKQLQDAIEDEKINLQKEIKRLEFLQTEIIHDKLLPQITFSKKTLRFSFEMHHSTSFYLDYAILKKQKWDIAFTQEFVKFAEWDEIYYENVLSILDDNLSNEDVLLLIRSSQSEYITITSSGVVTMDLLSSFNNDLKTQIFQNIFPSFQEIQDASLGYETIFLSGLYFIKTNVVFNKILFQDFILNDDFISGYFQVHELEKANKFGMTSLHCMIDNRFRIVMTQFEDNQIRVQFSKCVTDNDTLRIQHLISIFFERYTKFITEYLELYEKLVPKLNLHILENVPIKETGFVSDFSVKYKDLLKKTGYKTACRPKSRIPTLIPSTKAKTILSENPLKILEYPKINSSFENDLKIPTEYFACNDSKYAFPGISSLGGGDVFVPCCFNKNPRSSKSFLQYYFEKVDDGPEVGSSTTEHIKSDNQIIKQKGDFGKVYLAIDRFLHSIFPTKTPFRVGVTDDNKSLLHSLSFLTNTPIDQIEEKFRVICDDYPHLVNGIDSSEYIDPRKYKRVLELVCDSNIIIFYKDKPKEANIDILNPCFHHHTNFFTFQKEKPFLFILEHWGSSPDRYTKRKFPICEPIILDSSSNEKTSTLTRENLKLIQQVFSTRFMYSNQKHLLFTEQDIGIQLQSILYQVFDDRNRLRGVFATIPNGNVIYLETSMPLPPLSIRQTNFEYIKNKISLIENEYGIRPKYIIQKTFYVFEDTKYYLKIKLKNGIEWTVNLKTSPPNTENIIKTNICPILFQPSRYKTTDNRLILDNKISRMLMDYIVYLQDEKFIKVVKNHQYDSSNLNENIMNNPTLFRDGFLIVNDEMIRKKLAFHVAYSKLNNNPWYLPNFYKYASDFQSLVFQRDTFEQNLLNPNGVKMTYHIHSLNEWQGLWTSGYWYYRPEMPFDKRQTPMFFHKVKDIDEAVYVSHYWKEHQIYPNLITKSTSFENTVLFLFDKTALNWKQQSNEEINIEKLKVYVLLLSSTECIVFL